MTFKRIIATTAVLAVLPHGARAEGDEYMCCGRTFTGVCCTNEVQKPAQGETQTDGQEPAGPSAAQEVFEHIFDTLDNNAFMAPNSGFINKGNLTFQTGTGRNAAVLTDLLLPHLDKNASKEHAVGDLFDILREKENDQQISRKRFVSFFVNNQSVGSDSKVRHAIVNRVGKAVAVVEGEKQKSQVKSMTPQQLQRVLRFVEDAVVPQAKVVVEQKQQVPLHVQQAAGPAAGPTHHQTAMNLRAGGKKEKKEKKHKKDKKH